MIPDIGQFALIVSFVLATLQLGTHWLAKLMGDAAYETPLTRMLALCHCFCITIAFFSLISCYADSDFSVANVAANSHTAKPLFYKITASWGNHEGSMLLWVWILSLYGAALGCASFQKQKRLLTTALSVQGMISAGFLLFLLLTSNPFARLLPAPLEGNDLNPLLQDIGLALHPPVLYLGYVGFSIVYSLAIAALLHHRADSSWAALTRPWVLLTWAWLTLGIGLGSWWAYRELGWGGWWFWDPVENAALLPWLAGTALLHSLIVLEKKAGLKRWVLLLSILTFSLSLLGTFLVRSGIITSVHSFASDPARGIFILTYLIVICGGGLMLYAVKAPVLRAGESFNPLSRIGGIVLNNLFLMVACGTVALGTLYPMALEILGGGRVSVGAPFFNMAVLPILGILLVLLGIVPFLSWEDKRWRGKKELQVVASLLMAIAFACGLWFSPTGIMALITVLLASWAILGTLAYGWSMLKNKPGSAYQKLGSLSPSAVSMILSHSGVGLLALGIALSSYWKVESQFSLLYQKQVQNEFFTIDYRDIETIEGPNYRGLRSNLAVTRNGSEYDLYPEVRYYPARETRTSEVDYHSTPFADLYAVISEPSADGSLTARIHYLPGMNMIWCGIIMIAGGGFFASLQRWRKRNSHG